jgi:molecular chaperone HtpG
MSETKTESTESTESHEFQAEVSKLLHLMVHSVYSEKEVFLRELISNASDACDKLRYEAITDPSLSQGDEDFRVELSIDADARTLTLADNGIGMSHDELVSNLGTIARSGTGQFVENLTGDDAKDVSLIGQFGVGFYSAFMIAEKVDVYSRRAGSDEIWHWASDGSGSFTLDQDASADILFSGRGTSIVMHVREGDDEYLDGMRLRDIVRTYSDHVALPVTLLSTEKDDEGNGQEPEVLNTANALWARPKSEITDEQYKEFYHHVGHAFDDPWHRIHYVAEGRHSYTVLLFAPSMQPMDLFDPKRANRVKLYVNRVFITDDAPLLPGYLRFMRGVVDSQDMPLNMSREMLQNNPLVDNIRGALTKRVLSELKKKAEKTPEEFGTFWEAFGPVLKEGIYEDFERREDLMEIARFKSTKGSDFRSLKDYVADMKEGQEAIYYLAGSDPESIANSPQLEGYRARDIEVLLLADAVDGFWTQSSPGFDGKQFRSVTQGSEDLGAIAKEEGKDSEPDEDVGADMATLLAFMKTTLEANVSDVRASDRLTTSAVCLVAGDSGMDMQMEKILAQHNQPGGVGLRVLEVNPRHGLIKALATKAAGGSGGQDLEDAAKLLLDQAKIIEGDALADPTDFARRMADVMAKAFG